MTIEGATPYPPDHRPGTAYHSHHVVKRLFLSRRRMYERDIGTYFPTRSAEDRFAVRCRRVADWWARRLARQHPDWVLGRPTTYLSENAGPDAWMLVIRVYAWTGVAEEHRGYLLALDPRMGYVEVGGS